MNVMPSALDIIGAVSVFVSALTITFELQVHRFLSRICCIGCRCRRRNTTVTEE